MTSISPISIHDFNDAKQRISPFVSETPLIEIEALNTYFNANIFLKCEQFHPIRAFKMRGAFNFLLKNKQTLAESGVITHSSGNHGQALAYASFQLGIKCTVVVPQGAPQVKIEGMKRWNCNIVRCENNIDARESMCSEIQEREGQTLVPPYDHLDIIEGQGTAAMEIIKLQPGIEEIYCPLGGGGLLAGSLLAASHFSPEVSIYGCEPEMARDGFLGFSSGQRNTSFKADTCADGLRTTVGEINFPIIKSYARDILLCSEDSIMHWGSKMLKEYNLLIEPSSAVPLAILDTRRSEIAGKNIAVLISGGNVNPEYYSSN
ncbi:threonine ammonia-lyase [Luteibaculum oceani]|uniref:Threonine/serine dehydratase n=1 Tax=Luteibaculum oceani TaxID=1294296 RepID=A0A5C6VFE1_9FLAO|nr:threonine/serine dehydratase [Luteibaculum oceani]TXC82018.1 threonine/serine dehydratase [Luteibaculum oceani]